jgi:hypothetical protein
MEAALRHPQRRLRPWYGVEDIGRLLDEPNEQIHEWMNVGNIRALNRAGKRVGNPDDVLRHLDYKLKKGLIVRAPTPPPPTSGRKQLPSPPQAQRSPQTNPHVPAAAFLPPPD